LLNSSINQFSKYLEREPTEEHLQLVAQNQHLRTSLSELKSILKEKLESALRKQKLEVTAMMDDYVKLITKLLKDKEELTTSLEHAQHQSQLLHHENQ
jgi:ribosome recycling factor